MGIFKKGSVIILVFILLSACSSGSILSGGGEIIFGAGNFDDGITEEKGVFSPYEDIIIETYLNQSFGTKEIDFILLKVNNGSEVIYDEWYTTVDPSWDTLVYEFHLPDVDGILDHGDYILRMYKNQSEVIAEGQFSVE